MRGATAHFDAVVSGATSGVLNASLDSGVPVIFCVMTTDTMEQVSLGLSASEEQWATAKHDEDHHPSLMMRDHEGDDMGLAFGLTVASQALSLATWLGGPFARACARDTDWLKWSFTQPSARK